MWQADIDANRASVAASRTDGRCTAINERYGFSLYDSMIVAPALIVGAKTLYAEDLRRGQVIDDQLRIINPFLKT
jgi:predicted nucleic acid-binding protein